MSNCNRDLVLRHQNKTMADIRPRSGCSWVIPLLLIVLLVSCAGEHSEPSVAFIAACNWAEKQYDGNISNYLSSKILSPIYGGVRGKGISTSDIDMQLQRIMSSQLDATTLKLKWGYCTGNTAHLVYIQNRHWAGREPEKVRVIMHKENGRWTIGGWRVGKNGLGVEP
ncbi:hypothetical protein SAMN04489760_1661 [Syntrophus gentianae]|uniref:Uncharacterized protein n=1 Tax=Syntrophus gentianae TaxID=43775 RepID=A0A1H8BNM7_9BACT|nr:hypothetical protein [Syntrophus gentianae]SEM84455.1 hypothetical protein SAMN04489760_1661 [Syntrophus gentianae]